jgi:aryl-alcohol dehydrogenase-like predicted oxidoreductase
MSSRFGFGSRKLDTRLATSKSSPFRLRCRGAWASLCTAIGFAQGGTSMPLNHYVTLGRSGLRVSPLCLEAMTFGENLGWGSSVKVAQAQVTAQLRNWSPLIALQIEYSLLERTVEGDLIGSEAL